MKKKEIYRRHDRCRNDSQSTEEFYEIEKKLKEGK